MEIDGMHRVQPHAQHPIEPDWQAAAAASHPVETLVERRRFVMQAPLVELVRHGRKRSTIRYDDRGIEYPSSAVMPIYSLEPGEPHETARRIAEVRVERVDYVRCGDLSDTHARDDGFKDRMELVEALHGFYPGIGPGSLLAVYRFAIPAGLAPAASDLPA